MNKEIRTKIIEIYKTYTALPDHGIVSQLERQGITDHHAAYKTINAMKDLGELVLHGVDSLRLSIKAEEADAPAARKVLDYIALHWIAISALILSAIALFK